MNPTLDTILNHRSIRSFTEQSLSKEQVEQIVKAAQMASTSSYMQAYSIIGVTDPLKKQELAEITGQDYVKNNGHLFIFCADLYRHHVRATDLQKQDMVQNIENTEHLLVSSIDAALAAQNAALAAESLGLGMCFIGSIRNNIQQVDKLLSLPEHVIPLFGMVVGYPAKETQQKPRLSIEAVYFENEYNTKQDESLIQFDRKIKEYYQNRPENKRLDSWTDQMIRRFRSPLRMDVTDYVHKKGLNKR